ncbi:hypothetical protein BN2475_510039 [Paraburkholderia ribeironis]|uniref:Translocator protein BipD n=1 Tax=Paraburkholderia ribeironis TaxID=1247936 RepID=A0A1N7SC69_9BURK|nr:IpaD/SipD/SspD family type III secretion system needle tip protein [Paraburkholderia ribeironis]SIT44963.1 hypothetical protein BN2475_510039 [Paraburkholderia ribeironis]
MIVTNISTTKPLLNAQKLVVTQARELPSVGGYDDAPVDGTKEALRTGVTQDETSSLSNETLAPALLSSHDAASPEPQGMNSAPVFEALLQALENGEDALTDFAAVVQFLTKLLGEITDDIFGELGGWTHSGTDKDNNTSVHIDIDKIYAAFDSIFSKYAGYSKGPPPHFTAGSIDTGVAVKIPPSVDEWNKQLSPLFTVDGKGNVSMDTSSLNKLIDSVRDFGNNGGGTPPGVNSAAYQAWSTGFTAMKDQMQTSLQMLAEKYSHQNSNFDSMSKILSSSISAMLDTAKSYLNI